MRWKLCHRAQNSALNQLVKRWHCVLFRSGRLNSQTRAAISGQKWNMSYRQRQRAAPGGSDVIYASVADFFKAKNFMTRLNVYIVLFPCILLSFCYKTTTRRKVKVSSLWGWKKFLRGSYMLIWCSLFQFNVKSSKLHFLGQSWIIVKLISARPAASVLNLHPRPRASSY